MEEISFGVWLRKQRRTLDLSRQAFADQVGCAEVTLRRIEAGTLKPSKELANILLENLGIPEAERPRWISFARGLSHFPSVSISSSSKPITNLPAPLTTFIGREKEQTDAMRLLAKYRLVTLTGSGGVGKTRLSIKIGEQVIGNYTDGIWLVELAPILDPLLVPRTAATAIGLRDETRRPVIDMLSDYLREKQLLIILDNCEHVLDTCAELADTLLKRCPGLKILTTSREALGILGEVAYRVPSLELPDLQQSLVSLRSCESIRLFEERAQLAQMNFSLTLENASAVIKICTQLDGIPLAIELAAARVATFSIEQIEERLHESFGLLTTGSRTALPRHKTLRAAIAWSYDLLSPAEKSVFQRLSVFVNGWTLEAAEFICSDANNPSEEIADLLAQLTNKSLVIANEIPLGTSHRVGGSFRYRMLETIRQYADEKLMESMEAPHVSDQHLKYFADWIDDLASKYWNTDPALWMDQMSLEHNNLLLALEWALTGNRNEGIRLIVHLVDFWFRSGFKSEGLKWCRQYLASSEDLAATPHLVRALFQASFMAWVNDELAEARAWAQASLMLGKEINDQFGIARAHMEMARTYPFGSRESREHWNQSLEIARQIGNDSLIAFDLNMLGMIELREGNTAQARDYFVKSLDIAQDGNYKSRVYWPAANLGKLAFLDANLDLATTYSYTALASAREGKNKDAQMGTLVELTQIALRQGNQSLALSYLQEAKEISYDLGPNYWIESSYALAEALYLIWASHDYEHAIRICSECYKYRKRAEYKYRYSKGEILWTLGEWAQATGQTELGVRLAGAMDGGDPYFGKPMYEIYRKDIERNIAIARQKLDESTIATLITEGRAMTVEQAIELALQTVEEV